MTVTEMAARHSLDDQNGLFLPTRTHPSSTRRSPITSSRRPGPNGEKLKDTMFPNETLFGRGVGYEKEDEDEDEVVEEDDRQLLQRTSTSAVLHGRLDPDPSPFRPETESGERCVRDEIFAETACDRKG